MTELTPFHKAIVMLVKNNLKSPNPGDIMRAIANGDKTLYNQLMKEFDNGR